MSAGGATEYLAFRGFQLERVDIFRSWEGPVLLHSQGPRLDMLVQRVGLRSIVAIGPSAVGSRCLSATALIASVGEGRAGHRVG